MHRPQIQLMRRGLLAVALMLPAPGTYAAPPTGGGSSPPPPAPQVNCSTARVNSDLDQDSIPDREECDGTFSDAIVRVPSCTSTGADPRFCLNPNRRNLFMCIRRDVPSRLDTWGISDRNLVEAMERDVASGGLGVLVNFVDCALLGPNRQLSPRTAVIIFTENSRLPLNKDRLAGDFSADCPLPAADRRRDFGSVQITGTPADWNEAVVNTGVLDSYFSCLLPTNPTSALQLKITHIKNTAPHEAGGHDLKQATDPIYGTHYAPGSSCIIAQTVCATKGGNVSCKIPLSFCAPEQQGIRVCGNALPSSFRPDLQHPDTNGDGIGDCLPAM